MAGTPYDAKFFQQLQEGSLRSAREIVPLVLELLHSTSVIDVGCASGAWLSVFVEHGITEFLGVDGDYVNREALLIPQAKFKAHDLSVPLNLKRSFDLAVSLEVAEHLAESAAQILIDSITLHAPVVLFSAAIPFQGGEHHVNEQWPDYWAKRFELRGYLPVDCIRRRFWANDRVEWWYSQNAFIFAQKPYIDAHPALRAELGRSGSRALSMVHPTLYLARAEAAKQLERADELHGIVASARSFARGLLDRIDPRSK
jgi:hypothetical protein